MIGCLTAVFDAFDPQHPRQGFHAHRPRARITRLWVGHGQGQRSTQDDLRLGGLLAGIQYLRGSSFDDERNLAILERLQLGDQLEHGQVHIQGTPHLAGDCHHLRAIDAQVGFDHRQVDLGCQVLQIGIGHALVEDQDRRQIHPGLPGVDLASEGAKNATGTSHAIGRLRAAARIEHQAQLPRTRHPDLVAIPENDLTAIGIGQVVVQAQGGFLGRHPRKINTRHRNAGEDASDIGRLDASGDRHGCQQENGQAHRQRKQRLKEDAVAWMRFGCSDVSHGWNYTFSKVLYLTDVFGDYLFLPKRRKGISMGVCFW